MEYVLPLSLHVLPKSWEAGVCTAPLTQVTAMPVPVARKVHARNEKITACLSVAVPVMLMKTGLKSILDAKQIKKYITI